MLEGEKVTTEPTPPAPTPTPSQPDISPGQWLVWPFHKLFEGVSAVAGRVKFHGGKTVPVWLALLLGVAGGLGSQVPVASIVQTIWSLPWNFPTPTPPAPPAPPAPPTPPAPPAPIPAKGLHVLIVVDNANISKLPSAQVTALTAQSVRQYLNATCAKGVNGEPEFRILDKNLDMSAESQLWQDAYKLAAGKTLPFIVVSNGTTGFQGALPADTDSLLKLLQQYGG